MVRPGRSCRESWIQKTGVLKKGATEKGKLLTLEINAAWKVSLEGGATEILVADGHGPGESQAEKCPKAEL